MSTAPLHGFQFHDDRRVDHRDPLAGDPCLQSSVEVRRRVLGLQVQIDELEVKPVAGDRRRSVVTPFQALHLQVLHEVERVGDATIFDIERGIYVIPEQGPIVAVEHGADV